MDSLAFAGHGRQSSEPEPRLAGYSSHTVKFTRLRRPERPIMRELHQRHPGLRPALIADLLANQEPDGLRERPPTRIGVVMELLRLVIDTDAFGALALYRLKTACQRRGIPVVPRLAHRMAIAWAQVSIGDPVVVHPGVRLPHGQVVIDGFVEIHPGAKIRPFVTIGLREGVYEGPTIHRNVAIGTGAKIIGPVTIGEGAVIGANAVVVDDVPAGAVVAGVPARQVR